MDDDRVLEHDVSADELAEVGDAGTEQHRHLADAELVDEAEVQRLLDDVGAGDRDELVAGDLLRRRDRLLDAAGEGRSREPLGGVWRGGRWVTTTTGAPAGWLSPQPSVWSNSRRPAISAPQPDVSSCSIGALAASTEKLMLSCALGTTTSPLQYQSNNSAGLSSGWATNPSSDMHM